MLTEVCYSLSDNHMRAIVLHCRIGMEQPTNSVLMYMFYENAVCTWFFYNLHIDGLGHKPFKSGQAFFQNDDKNDKTHRAQNVYLSRRET